MMYSVCVKVCVANIFYILLIQAYKAICLDTFHCNYSDATFAFCRIGKLRKYLDPASKHKLVQAFVFSWLDNCNALLYYDLTEKDIR